MEQVNQRMFGRLIKTTCLVIVAIIVVAGLAPFHAPRNEVHWLANKNGLQFNRHSSIRSESAFHANSTEYSAESIELCLVPASLRSTNTIVAFDASDHPGASFLIRQYRDYLLVRRPHLEAGVPELQWSAVAKVFQEARPVFVTIVLNKQNTSVYLNGSVAQVFAVKGISTNNLTGRLVVANSPDVNVNWTGIVQGLAMFHGELTPAQIAEHHSGWIKNQELSSSRDLAPFALYLFNEQKGNIVRNQMDSATNLAIPERYFVLHPRFLASLKKDYRGDGAYWQDVALNIGGFIPLGFFVAIYFSQVRSIKYPGSMAVLAGLGLSLMIESLQVFLPTRSSGSTDLITNTLGTVLGVMFYRSSAAKIALARLNQFCSRGAVFAREQAVQRVSSESVTPTSEPTALSA